MAEVSGLTKEDEQQVQAKQGEFIKSASSIGDLQLAGEVLKGIIEPFAKAQETVAIEGTKKAQIDVDVKKKFHLGIFGMGILAFALAGAGLFLGDHGLAGQIVVAVLGFLGGYGFGKNAE